MRKTVWFLGSAGIVLWAAILSASGRANAFPADNVVEMVAQTGDADSPGAVLFADDFETYSNRWIERASPKALVMHRDGALALRVVSPGVAAWSVPDYRVASAEYVIRAALTVRNSGADAAVGCVVGYRNDADFFAFLVAPEGAWAFVHHVDGVWVTLEPDEVTEYHPDEPVTDLQVAIVGHTLHFWINTVQVGSVRVAQEFDGQGFGVIARAGRGIVDASFEAVSVNALRRETNRDTID